MNDSLTTSVADRYNQAAAAYRDLWAPTLRIAGRRLIRELASAQDGPAQCVVDVGAGVGTLMPELLWSFPGACVVGLDRSSGMLALAPRARGMGLGARLTDECIAFARAKGYRKMVLWTNSCLAAARGIYASRGFKLEKSEPYEGFGQQLVGETWSLKL